MEINQYWHTIVDLRRIDVCAVAKNVDLYPQIADRIEWFNETFGGIWVKCPWTVR